MVPGQFNWNPMASKWHEKTHFYRKSVSFQILESQTTKLDGGGEMQAMSLGSGAGADYEAVWGSRGRVAGESRARLCLLSREDGPSQSLDKHFPLSFSCKLKRHFEHRESELIGIGKIQKKGDIPNSWPGDWSIYTVQPDWMQNFK